jgi:hypothetical protein
MSMRIRPICKVYIHTYLNGINHTFCTLDASFNHACVEMAVPDLSDVLPHRYVAHAYTGDVSSCTCTSDVEDAVTVSQDCLSVPQQTVWTSFVCQEC